MDTLFSPAWERVAASAIKTGHILHCSHKNDWHGRAHIHCPQKHAGLILTTHWECQYVAVVYPVLTKNSNHAFSGTGLVGPGLNCAKNM